MSTVVDETLGALSSLAGIWDEETVDELDHARQAAVRARAARPDDDAFVVAALLHDFARAPGIGTADDHDHAAEARDWLTPRYGERVGWLAGAHVAAKVPGAPVPDLEALRPLLTRVALR